MKMPLFITKIQQSDEATKMRWLVILSSGTSLVIILLWALGLSLSFGNLNQRVVTENTSPSAWNTFTASVYTATQDFRNTIGTSVDLIKESLNQTRNVTVEVEE